FKIAKPQLVLLAVFDSRDSGCDLAGYKFETAPRAFVIEQNSAHAKHAVRLAVISGEIESGNFTNAIRRPRVKRRRLCLRHFPHFAKHFRRAGEVKTTFGL